MAPDSSSKHSAEADKNEEAYVEHSDDGRHPPGKAAGDDRINVTDADNSRILRRTDVHLLTLLCWVYFLQILDKSVIGYSAVWGLKTNAHLVGNQYSMVGSIGYYAQLVAQPLGAYLLVKLPIRSLLSVIVLCWGASLLGMAGSTNYHSLLASRFLLGFFEAACLPAFSLLTASWYRRQEQPLRVAAWYSTNGAATSLGSLLVYGLGHVHSKVLFSYQIIFLVCGVVTVITAPILYWRLDNTVEEARFLTPEDRLKGVERLRANQTGIVSFDFKLAHVWELFLDPKTYLFLGMSFLVNTGSAVSNVFGPLILQGIAGFSSAHTTLLNIPFGVLQFFVIIGSSYLALKTKTKSTVLACFMIPVIIGCALLYTLPHTKANEGPLLLGYYLLAFLFAGSPIIIAWITANTAGQTKKAALMCAYNAASSGGNILGPNLFKAKDAPNYKSGLEGVLAIFCAMVVLIILQNVLLRFLNKRKEALRVKHGKRGKIHDASMDTHFDNTAHQDADLGANAFSDLTDMENDEFVYVL